MLKTHLYFVPGLAANTTIFEHISLPKDSFELHYLDWIVPLSVKEPIEHYAKRMCDRIEHDNVILVGVSYGGVMVQEMSKILKSKKVIIISSIKCRAELPQLLRFAQKAKAYRYIPTKVIQSIEEYEHLFFGGYLKKKYVLYKKYMSMTDSAYLHWAVYNVLNWQQEDPLDNVVHIHGNSDDVFPVKYLDNYIAIKNGTHAMILTKAKSISKILEKECFL